MVLTLKYHIEARSNLHVGLVRESITAILNERKYDNVIVTESTISFNNGFQIIRGTSKDRVIRVERGKFNLFEEGSEIKVKLNYEISYTALLVALLISVTTGFLIDSHFFLLTGLAITGWPINYLILKEEAAELIGVCLNKRSTTYNS